MKTSGGLWGVLTALLLVVILMAGPLVLGAARLWFELPLLGGVALLLFIQALRLILAARAGAVWRIDAIDLSVVLFVVYTIARWLTSPADYFSRIEAMNVFAYAVIFLTCRYGLARRVHGLFLLGALVVLGLFETGFGYYLIHHSDINAPDSLWFPFGPTERLQLHYFPRWLGTYGCPNHYGALLVMAFAAAMALASFSKLSWPLRIVLFYLAALMMFGVMGSASRGSFVAAIAAILALTVFGMRFGTLRWWVPAGAAALLIAFVAAIFCISPVVQERAEELMKLIRDGQLDLYVRIQLAEDALRIAHDNPIFGTGPGTFVFVHPRYQSASFAFKAILTHDDYLNCLDDYGLAGLAIALFFVFAVTLKFFGQIRADSRWQDRVLVAAGFMAWVALLVHSFVDFNLHIPANALMLFALTGMALRPVADGRPVHWSSLTLTRWGQGLGVGALILSIAYGFEIWRSAMSDLIYEETFANASDVPIGQSIRAMQEALAYDPANTQAMLLLGDLYRYRASLKKNFGERIGDGQKALDAYQQAIKTNRLDDTIEARMGMTFDIMRRYSEAFFCYKAAATAQPHDGQFWNALGNHFWERGMLVKAEEAYLMASQCPHGAEGSADSARDLKQVLDEEGLPTPEPGANPLDDSPLPEPPTSP